MIAQRRTWSGALWMVILAAAPPTRADEARPAPDAKEGQEVRALADRIDHLLSLTWAEAKVEPAPRADDAEFLRRVCLDLCGRIPSVAEAREFLDDPAPDKRERLVARLLAGPAYANHFTKIWRNLLLPEAADGRQVQFLAPDFENWLRQRIAENEGYDKVARGIVALSLDPGPNGQRLTPFQRTEGPATPLAYYFAKEGKPENLAASTARTFLGIRIECAQCHDHPFAHWKREQFWGFAAFFGGIEKQGNADQFGPIREVADRRELAIPGSEKVVQASFLDGTEPQWKFKVGPRVTLADWMTAPENPYFARAGVNRLWAHLFGTGLVDPVDDMSDANPASHPELLDELAAQFARHGYDTRFLIRALTSSRAYQLSSESANASQVDPRLFARMAVKGLSAEQIYESLLQATGRQEEAMDRRRIVNLNRSEILQKFARRDEKPTESQTSILQALAMMNGQTISQSTSLAQGETLGAIVEAPFLDTPAKIETLFLATLTRRPRPEEKARLVAYVENQRSRPPARPLVERLRTFFNGQGPRPMAGPAPSTAENEALADVYWALLNSAEFLLNH